MKQNKISVAALIISILSFLLFAWHCFVPFAKPAGSQQANIQTIRKSMFSWEDEPYLRAARTDFYTVLEHLEITDVYQYFSDEKLYSDDATSFLKEASAMSMDVYYLAGHAQWGVETKPNSLKLVIDKVSAYNKSAKDSSKFKGIVFDVEPYLTEEWKTDESKAMERYVENMKAAYKYAKDKDLKVVICIPYWYDKDYSEQLEVLIADCSDAVSVMNYDRQDEKKNLEAEIALAKKHSKSVECIFEFQEVGSHDLTENETYYNAGLDAAKESFDKIYKSYNYNKLTFSYHYYKPVKELLN